MKVNISFSKKELDGYTNHSILETQNLTLDEVDMNELDEVIALGIIEYIPRKAFDQVLHNWISKLSHNGKLVLSFDDLYTITRLFFLQKLNFQEMNFLLHGPMVENWQHKNVNITIPVLCQTLETLGLKIESKKIEGTKATIVGVRP